MMTELMRNIVKTSLLFILITTHIDAENGANLCPFCDHEIIQRQELFEGSYSRIILDYAPITEGHLLIVPKIHVSRIDQVPKEFFGELKQMVDLTALVFRQNLRTVQYIVLEKNGADAGQSVPHVHFHLIPVKNSFFSQLAKLRIVFRMLWRAAPMQRHMLETEVSRFRTYFLSATESLTDGIEVSTPREAALGH